MAQGLNVNDVVHVTTSFTLTTGTYRNFNSCMVVGSTPNVIDVAERKRIYADIDGVSEDFPVNAPEYLWAQKFFSQSPQPAYLHVARWAQTATSGVLHGASLTPAQRVITVFNSIANGAMQIFVDGVPYALSNLNLTLQTNLNGIASVLQQALRAAGAAGATVVWNAGDFRFDVTSGSTGAVSSVNYARSPTASTSVSFTAQPASGSSLVLNGSTLLFGGGVGQVAIGLTLSATLANAAAAINASTDPQISLFTAYASGSTLYLTADASGTSGNALTVTASTSPASNASVSASPMIGGAGTDVSVLLGLSVTPNSTGANANPPVNGVAPESALSCIQTLGDQFGDWYAVDFAPVTPMSDADKITVAGYIESAGRSRIFGSTVQNTAAIDPTRSDDLGAVLQEAGFERSLVQYSTTSPYAMASLFGRLATINYLGANTTITLMFKQEPGIAAESLSENQWQALKVKNYNVSADYQNSASILQDGVMASGQFIDNRIGADWLADYLQTNAFNLLVSLPKVPQTDGGMTLIAANMTQSLEQGVTNGFIAPGQWNGPDIGTITNGKFLPTGYEIYYPAVASQSETDRAARKSVPFQIAVKLAGAVHSVDVALTLNP